MKQLLVLLMLVCAMSSFAQDVIVKKNGSTVVCRVVEVNTSEVVYKKWGDLNGSNYILNRTDITSINYENGRKENFSTSGLNEFAPGNQNSGEQSLNDNALLRLDIDNHQYADKAKKLRTIGWIGGASLMAGAGILCIITAAEGCDYFGECSDVYPAGELSVILAGGSIAWTAGFLIAANKQQKMAESIVMSSPILQNELRFSNGSTLAYSADLIKDNLKNQHTFGVGLRYNF